MWTANNLEALALLKRRIYLIAWPFGALSLAAAWVFAARAERITPIEKLIFPLMGCYLTLLIVALVRWRSQRSMALIEQSLFVALAASLLGRFYDILFSPTDDGHAQALADLLYWFPLVYLVAHLAFSRKGTLVCLLFFASLLGVGFVYVINEFRFGVMNDAYVLLRFYLGNAVYIALLVAVTLLKELYTRSQLHAQSMSQLAHTDVIVGLPNRRQLNLLLTKELERAKRFDRTFSVVFLDLDQFKQANDVYGHDLGDALLKTVANLVKQHLRPSDEIGRWGGDEFLVIAPELTAQQAALLAERLRDILARHPMEGVGTTTASFGVASYPRFETQDELLRAADRALARAKTAGKNRVDVEY
jgi:diguanylate cyclase